MLVLDILTVHYIVHVRILRSRHPSPGDGPVRANHNHALITHHDQEAALTICLVRDRVSGQDVVRAVSTEVSALHRDGVDELLTCGLELVCVAHHVRCRQKKCGPVEGCEENLHVDQERVHDVLRVGLTVDDFNL